MTADREALPSFIWILPLTLRADDDRVVPLHSFKHAAALQHAAPENPQPLLIRIDRKAGHGAGKSTEKRWAIMQRTPKDHALIRLALGLMMLRPD